MSNLIRWEPFGGLVSLRQAMDRLFEDAWIRPSRFLSAFGEESALSLDMYQTEEDVVVKVPLPGIKPEEVDITITGDTLTIKGETKAEEEVKKENYLHQERRYGAFSRSVALPGALKTDKAEATFESGILKVTIPKAEEAKPKVIKVQAKGVVEGKKD